MCVSSLTIKVRMIFPVKLPLIYIVAATCDVISDGILLPFPTVRIQHIQPIRKRHTQVKVHGLVAAQIPLVSGRWLDMSLHRYVNHTHYPLLSK